MPVWMVCGWDPDEGWQFVAAPTRNEARSWFARFEGHDYETVKAQRLWSNGTQGGRPRTGVAQVTVEREEAGELSMRQLASIGYRVCDRCEEVVTNNPSGLCDGCDDEAQDEADAAMDLAHGEGGAE